MEHGREHIYRRMHKKTSAGQTEGCAGPHRDGGGRGRGRTRGEENYKRFCGVPFQGRRPKGNVIVVWYTSRAHTQHGYIIYVLVWSPCSLAHEQRGTSLSPHAGVGVHRALPSSAQSAEHT